MTNIRRPALLALSLLALLGTSTASALTWVRVDDLDLVRQSSLIVEATARETVPAAGARVPSTDQRFEVARVIHGELEPASDVTVRWLGGPADDGTYLKLHGIEPATQGSRVLLFLGGGADQTFRVLHLVQGHFRLAEHEGETYAYRVMAGTEMSPEGKILSMSADSVFGEVERSRHLEAFVDWIRVVAEGEPVAADYWRQVPLDVLRAAHARQTPTQKFELFANPFRWRAFDSNNTVSLRAHQAGQPMLVGGGFGEFRRGINAWNNDTGSNVLYRYAGMTSATGGFNGQDGVNAILFDDLNGAGGFDEPFDCIPPRSGTIAIGGGYVTNPNHSHQGTQFGQIVEADIITNKDAGCILTVSKTAEEVFGHELGHTLGLGHSCDDGSGGCNGKPLLDDALMRSTAHADGRGARLNADDRAGIAFLYPAGAQSAPTAPSGLSATVNGAGFVNISWSDNSGNENGFSIERRTDNLSGQFTELTTAGRNVSSFQDLAPPTGSTVSYRVRAFNGVGNSAYTNVATVATQGPTPPSLLEASPLSSHQVELRWTDNTADETDFQIQIRQTPGEFEYGVIAEVEADQTVHLFEELFVDTGFQFRVRAITEDGPSSWSEPVTATTPPYTPGECEPGPGTLCLTGDRFLNRVLWRTTNGAAGIGQKVASDLATDSGLFYFFGEENWEILVKNLDGCGINDSFWVFSAATTDVQYTLQVVDTATGTTAKYLNPGGSAAATVIDIDAFVDACTIVQPVTTPQSRAVPASLAAKGDGCPANAETLVLGDRFDVELTWRDFEDNTGSGKAVGFCTADSGLMWFFGEDNWELLIKVLDACAVNQHFWVFSAATTTVEYSLKVTDTDTGQIWETFNPLGQASVAVTDTEAFPTCDD